MLVLPWNVPKLWDNTTAFIIGGGLSLCQMDLSCICNQHIIGVNDAFKLGNWIDVCWFGDRRWWHWNKIPLRSYTGLLFGCPPGSTRLPKVWQVQRVEGSGIITNPKFIMWNKSSGGSAINLAYHLGAKRIVLLGYDMKAVNNVHNWHSNHKHTPRVDIYEKRFLPPFQKIAKDAEHLGIEIVNATPDSALTIFPFVELSKII